MIFISVTSLNAQDLNQLLDERKKLYSDYDALKSEKNSIWGNASKQDLQNLISNLKGIIAKDNQIIQLVYQSGIQKEKELKKEKALSETDLNLRERNLADKVSDLQLELDKQKGAVAKKNQENVSLQHKCDENKDKIRSLEIFSIILLAVIGVMTFLLVRKKKNNQPV